MTVGREHGARAGLQRRARADRLARGGRPWRGGRWRASTATSTRDAGRSDLTRTEKSLVAIARALAVDCDFLVLDEPTASLPADEVERLFEALRPLRRDAASA